MKVPYVCPHVEDITAGVTYAITLNGDDTVQMWDSVKRIDLVKTKMVELLYNHRPSCIMDLHMEVSNRGRLHWHGTIEIVDVLAFFVLTLPFIEKHHTYAIKPLKEADKDPKARYKTWDEYCTKQKLGLPRVHSPKDVPLGPTKVITPMKIKSGRGSGEVNLKRSMFDYDDI